MKIEHFHSYTILVIYHFLAFFVVAHAQDQTGFISLDCGSPKNTSFAEPTTGINYISDEPFINSSGVSNSILPLYRLNLQQHAVRLRSFPDGIRNCYTINIKKGTKYLIRLSFLYGNYDAKNNTPKFDIHLGANFWDTVKVEGISTPSIREIIHVPLQNYVRVCLVNTGTGTPFVNAIELRPLKNNTYEVDQFVSLAMVDRLDIGSTTNGAQRFPEDVFDRKWGSFQDESVWTTVTTSLSVESNEFRVPSQIMRTAATTINESAPLELFVTASDESNRFYVYLHFAELEKLKPNESRAFDIKLNSVNLYKNCVPNYLSTNTIYSISPFTGRLNYTISINKAWNSTLPPILNAIELYSLIDLSLPETAQADVDALTNVKSAYRVNKRNWDGDPCLPSNYSWVGLNCNFDGSDPPRVTSLNLSSSGLTGEISTHISELTELESLDLSNNNLTGSVPDFLSQLSKLKVLNLGRNKLTGLVPAGLVERSKDGSLSISIEGNPDLCESFPCKKNKKSSKVIPIVASAGGFVILSIVVVAIILIILMNKKKRAAGVNDDKSAYSNNFQNDSFEFKQRQFTYSEIVKITNNFERILGKGGFGTVYHGLIDNVQVAVKMLSASSVQGFQQFQAEVKLLMRVHHRNLTTLVGYCNEGTNLALIYEYMPNGSLDTHLSDDSRTKVLSWEERLHIALDAAQGLEYLHSGCKPAIVHRDVKAANILLNENFQAKIADFGLSKFFPTDGGTHVSTIPAGTPGYLDPEYYMTHRLVEKSDVYSFGVVLLEIITNRPAISRVIHERDRGHITQWVSFMLANGDVKSIVDPKLEGNFEINSIWKAVEVGMACVSKKLNMSQVVIELKECLALELAQRHDYNSSRSVTDHHSVNDEMLSLDLDVMITESHPLAR